MKKTNVLRSIHDLLTHAPIKFRDQFREECACSIPTYYRKIRPKQKNQAADVSYVPLSNAEKKAAIEQGDKFVSEFRKCLDQLRKEIL